MNQLIAKSLQSFQQDLQVNYEVNQLLRDMVESVSLYHMQNELLRLKDNYQLTEGLNTKLLERIQWLESEYDTTKRELTLIKFDAKSVREKFVSQIGSFLSDNRTNQKLKLKILELEDKLSRMKPEEAEETEATEEPSEKTKDKEESQIKEESAPAPSPKKPKNALKLMQLEEKPLLHLFSFLQTIEVLNYAQVNRFVYHRIDKIFGIDSASVQPDWATLPPPPSLKDPTPPKPATVNESMNSQTILANHMAGSSQVAKPKTEDPNAGNEIKLTRDVVDELTKKLAPQQMKLILSIAEKAKKQAIAIDILTVEKDDLSARLQNTESIRDFLIEKLKTAELAIKSMMNETSTLKKQSASDSEIISYLDLQVQDLDGQLLEANHRCSHLQASLELQVNSLSIKVIFLRTGDCHIFFVLL
jgi:hypothetical protein